jgi:GNAT superfamily N-acetyltransferase
MNKDQSSPPITVRPATEDDADAIARLACDLGYPVDPDAMRLRIQAVSASPADSLFVAADSSNTPVGWLQAHSAHVIESGFRVEILGLVVSPTVRRAGIGRALVAEAERWATSIGAEAVVVRSNVKRIESHAFYPALGYNSTKTQFVYRKPLFGASPH